MKNILKKLKRWWIKHKMVGLDIEMSIFAIDYQDWKQGIERYEQMWEETK